MPTFFRPPIFHAETDYTGVVVGTFNIKWNNVILDYGGFRQEGDELWKIFLPQTGVYNFCIQLAMRPTEASISWLESNEMGSVLWSWPRFHSGGQANFGIDVSADPLTVLAAGGKGMYHVRGTVTASLIGEARSSIFSYYYVDNFNNWPFEVWAERGFRVWGSISIWMGARLFPGGYYEYLQE